MWQHRNQKEHINDNATELDKLHQEVEEEIAIGQQNIPELEILYKDTEVEKVTGTNTGYIRAWLRNVKARR
jgi:hypothetical protein